VGPLRLLSRSAVIGLHTHDLFDHVWLHRGFLGSLFGDGSPLQTTAIAWPEGGSILHPDPAGALLFSLLAPLLGSVSAYNWMLLVQLWLAALAGWALCRRVTGSTLSGWFGGLLIGASPYLLGQVNTGETETVAVWPLILGLLYMERVTETRSWRDGILAGLFAGLGAVASWYHGAFLAFYLVGWLAVRARCPACIAVPALFAAVVAVPAAISATSQPRSVCPVCPTRTRNGCESHLRFCESASIDCAARSSAAATVTHRSANRRRSMLAVRAMVGQFMRISCSREPGRRPSVNDSPLAPMFTLAWPVSFT